MKIRRTISITTVCVLLVTVISAVIVYAPPPTEAPSTPFQEVIVANTDPIPVDVTTSLEPEFFQIEETETYKGVNGLWQSSIYRGDVGVPEGKILVIESISGRANLEGSDSLELRIVAANIEECDPTYGDRYYLPTLTAEEKTFNELVKFYLGPDQTIIIEFGRFGEDTSYHETVLLLTFTGYFVDFTNIPPNSHPMLYPCMTGHCVGEEQLFFGEGSYDAFPGSIVAYDWDFGDSTTATDMNPEHVYTTAGTYTVTLTVTDDQGLTDTDTITVEIVPPS